GERADDLIVDEKRHRGGTLAPLAGPALEAAAREPGRARVPVTAEHLQPGSRPHVNGDASGPREPPGNARDAPGELARVLPFERRVGELGRGSRGEKGSLDPALQGEHRAEKAQR